MYLIKPKLKFLLIKIKKKKKIKNYHARWLIHERGHIYDDGSKIFQGFIMFSAIFIQN